VATKKQKRAEALARREKMFADLRLENQKALEKERERREKAKLKEWQKIHEEKHFGFVDNCPHCALAKKALRTEKVASGQAQG
jgi:hypothetical protein